MTIMILGLIFFLGVHSIRIYANSWRGEQINKRGKNVWQGIYTLISLLGFILIIWGYGDARVETLVLWYPPIWTKHLAALFVLISFIFFVAADLPGTKIKSKIGHPMIVGVKLWAFGHLITNGALVDIILFGSFLLWAILDFRAARQRDKENDVSYEFLGYRRDILAVAIGLVIGIVFALYFHNMLIGVTPFS